MDRIINFKVTSSHLLKDSNSAGVRGEANSTILRIKFDESWDGYAKTVVFRDAKGENPVKRVLTADLLENIAEEPRIYLCPIPAEPLAYEGKCEISIDGYVGGKRIKSYSTSMTVWHSENNDNAGEAADPTPTQAEQLQVQIDSVLSKIQRAIEVSNDVDAARETAAEAQNIANAAVQSANEAAGAAASAAAEAQQAATAFNVTSHAHKHAAGGVDAITPEMIGAASKRFTIPDGYDLNNYTESGFYRLSSAHGHMPTGCDYGQMIVVQGGGDTVTQICVAYTNTAYMRSGNPLNGTGAWHEWRQMILAGDNPSLINAASSYSIYNIDEIHPSGIYRVAGNAGTFPAGCENGIGTLINTYWDANYGDQIFISYFTFHMYRRRRNGSAWEPWYIINDGFTFTKSTIDIGEGAAMLPNTWYAVYE